MIVGACSELGLARDHQLGGSYGKRLVKIHKKRKKRFVLGSSASSSIVPSTIFQSGI